MGRHSEERITLPHILLNIIFFVLLTSLFIFMPSCGNSDTPLETETTGAAETQPSETEYETEEEPAYDPNEDEDLQWIKSSYYQYLSEEDMFDPAAGTITEDNLKITDYVGTFGDCVIAYMSGDGLDSDALREERYGINTIVYSGGRIYYAFYDNEAHPIYEAYEEGLLTDDDILEIKAAVEGE